MILQRTEEGLREVGWLASDAYVAIVSNVGAVAGNMLNGLITFGGAWQSFEAQDWSRGVCFSAATLALEGLAFHGAILHDRIEAAEAARQPVTDNI